MDPSAYAEQQGRYQGRPEHVPDASELLCSFLSVGQQQADNSLESIMCTLEASHSLLAGMFRDFVQEACECAAAAASGKGSTDSTITRPAPPTAMQYDAAAPAAAAQRSCKRARDTEVQLNVTLEELFSGAVKRVPVPLRRRDEHSGGAVTVMQQLQVCLQPGLQEGARITLPG